MIIYRTGEILLIPTVPMVPGDIYSLEENNNLFVFTGGNGSIEILELQPAGKRRMKAKEFLRGHKLGQATNSARRHRKSPQASVWLPCSAQLPQITRLRLSVRDALPMILDSGCSLSSTGAANHGDDSVRLGKFLPSRDNKGAVFPTAPLRSRLR